MKKWKEERFRDLVIEEFANREATRDILRSKLKKMREESEFKEISVGVFAFASGFITGVITSLFFHESIITVFVNAFIAGFFAGYIIGCIHKYIAEPIIESMIINRVIGGKKITKLNILCYNLPSFFLWVIILILVGRWIGAETIFHNGLYVWDWLGDLFNPMIYYNE